MKALILVLAALAVQPAAKAGQEPGTVTPELVAANFDRADANKDGKLTREEFAATPRGKAPNDIAQTFPASDVNGDGVVSKDEFVSMVGMKVVNAAAPAAQPSPK